MDDLKYKYLKNTKQGKQKLEELKVLNELFGIDTASTAANAGFANPGGTYKRKGNLISWGIGKLAFARGKAKRNAQFNSVVDNIINGLASAKDPNQFLVRLTNEAKRAGIAGDTTALNTYKEALLAAHTKISGIASGDAQPETTLGDRASEAGSALKSGASRLASSARTGISNLANKLRTPTTQAPEAQAPNKLQQRLQQNRQRYLQSKKDDALMDTTLYNGMPNDRRRKKNRYSRFTETIENSAKYIIQEEDKNASVEKGLMNTPEISAMNQRMATAINGREKELLAAIENSQLWRMAEGTTSGSRETSNDINKILDIYKLGGPTNTHEPEKLLEILKNKDSELGKLNSKLSSITDEKEKEKYAKQMSILFSRFVPAVINKLDVKGTNDVPIYEFFAKEFESIYGEINSLGTVRESVKKITEANYTSMSILKTQFGIICDRIHQGNYPVPDMNSTLRNASAFKKKFDSLSDYDKDYLSKWNIQRLENIEKLRRDEWLKENWDIKIMPINAERERLNTERNNGIQTNTGTPVPTSQENEEDKNLSQFS